MARQARGEVIDPSQVQIVHTIQRCVRQAFLCGDDPYSGKSYEHRRGWIRDRLELLASVFGIDCLTFTAMSNHLHLVLRSRPDVVETWSDEQVARKWLKLFPKQRHKDGSPAEPSAAEISMITEDLEVLNERRRRLSDISWWMRCTSEEIARRANREEEISGRFWQGRFKAQVLMDESSLLACAAYVDLNPIRAAMAETLEASQYTGAKERIDDLAEWHESARKRTHQWERSRRRQRSGWLSPVEIDKARDPAGPDPSPNGRRASQKGFLPISLLDYLQLLDWTGRTIRRNKHGAIPARLAPILQRIGLEPSSWCELVQNFSRHFKRVAGTTENLATEAARRGQRWLQAPGNPLHTVS